MELILQRKTKLITVLAIAVYMISICLAITVDRAFFYDGANFFAGLLSRYFTWPFWSDDIQHMRLHANLLNQIYISSAIKLDLNNIEIYKKLFNFGLFINPIFAYLIIYKISKNEKNYNLLLFSLASYATSVIQAEIFILNQAIITVSLVWVLIAYILLMNKYQIIDCIVIFIIQFILIRAHESTSIFGIILIITSLIKIYSDPIRNISRINIIILINNFIIEVYSIWFIFSHPLNEKSKVFISTLLHRLNINQINNGIIFISILTITALFIVILLNQRIFQFKLMKIFYWILVFIMPFYGLSLIVNSEMLNPLKEFQTRGLIVYGSSIWMVFYIFIWVKKYKINSKIFNEMVFCIAVSIISSSFWQIGNSIYWSKYSNNVKNALENSRERIVPYQEVKTHLDNNNLSILERFDNNWSWPVYGLALQDSNVVNKIFTPNGFEEYFKMDGEKQILSLPFVDFYKDGFFDFSRLINEK